VLEEVLFEKGATLVRRLRLDPGDTLPWHVDPWHRVSIVLRGAELELEYRDTAERKRVSVRPGQVDWDEPTDRPHRARNVGGPYEEVTIFFRERAGEAHQPRV
jgi:quercetin dioxygenase-like cupin family protein